jgi:hypothetical protein
MQTFHINSSAQVSPRVCLVVLLVRPRFFKNIALEASVP